MPLVRVPNCGAVGLNKDLSQHDLPLNAWTDARNIRFLNGYAWQFYGYGQVYDTPSIVPYHLLPVTVGTVKYWIYAGAAKAYAVTITAGAAVHTNITRQTAGVDVDYTATPNTWTSTLIGGIPVLNNGTDAPQFWDLNIANNLAALTAWPANTTCKALRSYKNYLIALDVTKAGARFPFMVKWSDSAVPGALPATWDETDTTADAGETDLAEGPDYIIDGLALRDTFLIYKQASVWRMDYIGGEDIFRFSKVLGTSGALNRNCIVDIDGAHVVLTGSDVILHDGQSGRSCLDRMTRRFLFQDIDVDNAGNAFVFKHSFFNEVYICYPSIGSTACNRCIVWNWVENTCSIRDVPNIYHAAYGSVDNTLSGTWASDSAPWASDLTAWNGPDFVPSNARVLMGGTGPKLYMLDSSSAFDGALPTAYLERRGLSFDFAENMKIVKGIRPRVMGNTGDTITFYVGGQTDPWAEPEWSDAMTHTIGSTVANDCFVTGRYIALKVASGSAYQWRLDSFDLDVEAAGNW